MTWTDVAGRSKDGSELWVVHIIDVGKVGLHLRGQLLGKLMAAVMDLGLVDSNLLQNTLNRQNIVKEYLNI